MESATDPKRRFEQLALPQLDAVYRMACRLSQSENEAEDLVQETFVRAFRSFESFELRAYGIKPWLLRILHNVFYTDRGRRRRVPTLMEDVDFLHASDEAFDASAFDSIESIDWDHFDQELKVAVTELQPEYRVVLLLWAVEDLSYKEIAEVCGCPIGTVMSRLYRARQLLGARLQDFARERNLKSERFDG